MKLENAILITGASQRIGSHLVERFLQAGDYPVIFTYRTYQPKVDELVKLGALAIQSDFCQAGALEQLIATLNQQVTSLRAIIHNASLWLDDRVENSFDQQWQVHVKAPYMLNEGLADLLNASTSPLKDIISLTDASLVRGGAYQVGYFASKAALQNMALSFAKRFAPDIKVNDIAPGLIEFNKHDSAEYKARRLKEMLISIEPGMDVIWQAVNYIMQSPYTTGSSLKLDGGRTLV